MNHFASLSDTIRKHIQQITRTSGLSDTAESHELMAKAWLEKNSCFEQTITESAMEETTFFGKDEARGAMILTWSGSLINIGPMVDGKRHCAYTSIGIRTDVPASALHEAAILEDDLETDQPALFKEGPIQQSSPIYKIAVVAEKLPVAEEAELLEKVNQTIAEDFVEVNKTIIG
ncbi:MAG: RNA-dependent RNA-polymerase [Spirochaetes bacterium]|nr:RNA-dependent RNA-polymerase [Spirochaetota bacterium]MBU0954384.1 RNA-dependent RNA-polymerase [Spirochaetota bacterium]